MIKVVKQTGLGLDREWIELLKEAKEIGITTEEIRLFLNESSQEENGNH